MFFHYLIAANLFDTLSEFPYQPPMQERFVDLLLFYPVFLFSLSFHEAAHGLVAKWFGDFTAEDMGRVSLNPIVHMDFLGTVFLPVFGLLTGVPVIGWGKPVPVNSDYFKNPRRDTLWVALAGPVSNLILTVFFAAISWGAVYAVIGAAHDLMPNSAGANALRSVFSICRVGVLLNLMLATFNLLPFPPLDGGNILRGLLPERLLPSFDDFSRISFFVLLLLFVTGLLKYLYFPVAFVADVLLPL